MSLLLLDTCAVIWLAQGAPMASSATTAIRAAAERGDLYASPVSAWEIGLLSRPRPLRTESPQFLPDPKTWFAAFAAQPGVKVLALTPEIMIDASHLPGELHSDPADRLIIAAARNIGAAIVTRDRKILDYSTAGHVAAIPC